MHPILIRLGSFPIHTFGVLMGSGFLVGILYSLRQSRKWGLDPDGIFNLCFWIMVSGVLGARVLYIAIDVAMKGHDSEFYSYNLLKLFALWEGGLVWYGGFIAAATTGLLYLRRHGFPVWRAADMLVVATFMGLAIGRIGCLMAGDDFGRPTTMPWGIVFRNPDALVYPPSLMGVPLHPTQLYMSLKSFTVALVCHLVIKHRKRFDGQIMAIAMMLYATLRYSVEIFRGDDDRGWIPYTHQMFSTSQGIGIAVFALGAFLYWNRRAAAPPLSVTAPQPPMVDPAPMS